MKVILASQSPRRRELLSKMFSEFEIFTADVDETLPPDCPIEEGVRILALRKGEAAARYFDKECMIISSDTLVELDGTPLGKPKTQEEAELMLRNLSGRAHNVRTGLAVHLGGRVASATATSSVYFRNLTDKEIKDYVATGEPMDKAGAYGIQGKGGALVSHYEGDFDTIVGLSLNLLKKLIKEVTEEND